MTSEERLRDALLARAWDLRANLPEGIVLPPCGLLEESVSREEFDIIVAIRRKGAAAPPPGPPAVPDLGPLQRYLPGCGLTDVERRVVDYLLAGGNRDRHLTDIRDEALAVMPRPPSEGTLKGCLARLANAKVGVLVSHRRKGYRLAPGYLAFLAWLDEARRAGLLAA